MTDMPIKPLRHSHLLAMLYVVLKEMRTNEHPNYAKAMAQTFHALPVRMAEGKSAEEILAELRRLADANGTRKYLDDLEAHSRERGWLSGQYVMDGEMPE